MSTTTIKTLKILILATSLSLPATSQLTRLHNAPRGGDEIIKQRVEYKDPGRDGENVIWNFGQLQSIDPEYTLTYYNVPLYSDSTYLVLRDTIPATEITEGDLIIGIEHHTGYFYRMLGDTLFTIGFENPVVLMKHNPPLLTVPFPFAYDTEVQSNYNSKGLYSLSVPITTKGSISLKADAYGKMVLPSGDTLDHVLRIKTFQTIEDTDTTTLENEAKLKMEIETYRWYAKGYRYPVFETTHTFDISDTAKTEIFATSFFYPPIEHYYLEQDSANLAVLDSLWHLTDTPQITYNNNEDDDYGQGENSNTPLNLKYNYYPNPVRDILYIEYYFEAEVSVSIQLFDINGIPVLTIPKGTLRKGFYIEEIECATLTAGSYVLRLEVGEEVVSGVVIKK
jgi:hypothetical protein